VDVESRQLAHHAEARAAQAVGVEKAGVVGLEVRLRGLGCGVGRVHTGEDAEQHGGISNAARHGSGGVLGMRDGNDATAAEETDSGLDADNSVQRRRRNDGTVGLGADRNGAQVGRDGNAGAGT